MGAAGVTLAGYSLAAKRASAAEVTNRFCPGREAGGGCLRAISAGVKGSFDQKLYQQVIGARMHFKEGDETIGVGAKDETTRQNARAFCQTQKSKISMNTLCMWTICRS